MKFLTRFFTALALGLGMMLVLYACHYVLVGARPSQGFLWLMQSVGFCLAMGYYFRPSKK